MCCPFQCPNCQSQNIRNRNLVPGSASDEAFACLSIQATLDAFWARSSKTVSSHRSEVRFMKRYADQLDIPTPFPRLGPFPLGHHLGMQQAIMMERRSLEKGRKKETVSWGTTRKQRATGTVLWESSPDSGSDISLSSGSRAGRFIATCNPTEGRWFQHLTTGMCARIGDIVSQDRAYTIGILRKLLEMYELEWNTLGMEMPLNSICSCMFLLVTCLGGMRGFEAVWTDMAALRYDIEYCEEMEDESAVAWPIVGRFKGEGGVAGCYMIPIAGTTDSGIPFFEWTQRFVVRLGMDGIDEGWAFQRPDGSRALASDYRDNIFSKLEIIQATTTLIDPECNIWDDFGIQRSGRRFFTTYAIICGVATFLIELQARWSTDRANGERSVKRSMIHTYAEVRNMKDTLKQPSQAF